MSKDNSSVFPLQHTVGEVSVCEGGITKREYFALQIFLTLPKRTTAYIESVQDSVFYADELMKELDK